MRRRRAQKRGNQKQYGKDEDKNFVFYNKICKPFQIVPSVQAYDY